MVLVTTCTARDALAVDAGAGSQIAIVVDHDADRSADLRRIREPFDRLTTTAWPAVADPSPARRAIAPDAGYILRYAGVPLVRHRIALDVPAATMGALRATTGLTDAPDGAVVRFAVMDRVADALRAAPLLHRGDPRR